MQYLIYFIGWSLAVITIIAWVRKAADNQCPDCNGSGQDACGPCPTCNGEGKL